MRLLAIATVALALLAAAAPAAVASHGLVPPVQCDVDDDLYNHCHALKVHWVTGPDCAGLRLGSQAECHDLIDRPLLP